MRKKLLGLALVLVLGGSLVAPAVVYAAGKQYIFLNVWGGYSYTYSEKKWDTSKTYLQIPYYPYLEHEFSLWILGYEDDNMYYSYYCSDLVEFGVYDDIAQFVENSVHQTYAKLQPYPNNGFYAYTWLYVDYVGTDNGCVELWWEADTAHYW